MGDKDSVNLLLLLVAGFIIWKMVKGKVALSGTSNEEVWEIQRAPDGSLQNIVIHRNVKTNG